MLISYTLMTITIFVMIFQFIQLLHLKQKSNMYLDIFEISNNKNFVKMDKVMCSTCLGWSDLTIEERVKIYCRGDIVKDVEMGEWYAEGEDYVRWARIMFIETGLCFSKPHYDYIFNSYTSEDGLLKATNQNGKNIFRYDSSGRSDEIEDLLRQLRSIRMKRFNRDNSPELITVMYDIETTDEEVGILRELHRLGFPNI